MAQQLKIFASHSVQNRPFCRTLVAALREAGAEAWYVEENLGPEVLRDDITRELAERPIFLAVLSPAAFAASWVRDECQWAYDLPLREPDRLLLPIVAGDYGRRASRCCPT
jgi:hypothetical protein